jgi:hypothetical protein
MSDRPLAKSAHAETPKQSSVEDKSSSKTPASLPRWSNASRWLTYAALALAVVAVALTGLAYFYPAHKGASVAQQGGDAKANVCSAFTSARKAVVINTHLESPNPDLQLSVAANARLALVGGGAYLRDRLDANTAAPADLANAANSFATTIQQLGINYLAEAGTDIQDPLRHDLDSQITQIAKMCT